MVVGFILLVTVVTIVAAVASQGAVAKGSSFQSTTAAPITTSDHVRGATTSPVSLLEYGDYECPACALNEPVIEKLESDYAGRVQFVFRNFPLPQHPDAMISSQAAEAAGLQGKFWEMHSLLYQKQNEWITASPEEVIAKYFDGYAKTIGLNVAKFDADIQTDAVKNKVKNDFDSGNAAKIDHTPTFFINLKQVQNPASYDEFRSLIDAALASSTDR